MTATLRTLRLEYSLPDAKLRGNYTPASKGGVIARNLLKQEMRFDAGLMAREVLLHGQGFEPPFVKARITYRFFHWRKIDLVENLVVGMKSFLDGLADANVFPNDDPDHVVPGLHTFTKCKRGESRVEIVVEELN